MIPWRAAVISDAAWCQSGCRLDPREIAMSADEAVRRYYDAWQNKAGDFSEVPLAEDFEFTGPVASFDSAEGTGRWRARRGGP